MTDPSSSGVRRGEALAWALALATVVFLIAAYGYGSRDPDSALYARIVADLAGRPFSRWLAPVWPMASYMQGWYREHPAGIFAPAALLARAGYPAAQAAYAVNALYQVLTLLLAVRVAAAVVTVREARVLLWVLQLLPVAFVYRARANQEQAVLLFFLLALWGVASSRRSAWGVAGTVAGWLGLLLVKGVLALPAMVCGVAWAALLPPERRGARAWVGLGLAGLACAGATAAYEWGYRAVTGVPFLADYLGRQVGSGLRSPLDGLTDTLYNVVWYTARLLWFAFPWSLLALAFVPQALRALRPAHRGSGPEGAARAGAAFALVVVLVYVGALSFGGRLAERYIFPAYFVVGAAGAILALRRGERMARLAARLDRGWVGPALFVLLLVLHVAGGQLGLPRIKM